jgi:hypothetical protein
MIKPETIVKNLAFLPLIGLKNSFEKNVFFVYGSDWIWVKKYSVVSFVV